MIPSLRLFAATLAIAAAMAASSAEAADSRFCKEYGTGESTILLLIDRTSPLRSNDDIGFNPGAMIERAKIAAMDELKDGQRLEISTITDNVASRRIVYSDCLPGRKVGLLDRPLSRVKVDADKDTFRSEVEAALAAHLRQNMRTGTSGVLETITHLSRQFPDGSIARLVIYSDLLDSNEWNGYWSGGGKAPDTVMPPHQLQSFITAIGRTNRFAALKGTEVTVYGFGFYDFSTERLNGPVRDSIEQFWSTYFERSGTRSFKTMF